MEPVDYELMLYGIEPLVIGDEVPVTLRFQSGETFAFAAIVQELDQWRSRSQRCHVPKRAQRNTVSARLAAWRL